MLGIKEITNTHNECGSETMTIPRRAHAVTGRLDGMKERQWWSKSVNRRESGKSGLLEETWRGKYTLRPGLERWTRRKNELSCSKKYYVKIYNCINTARWNCSARFLLTLCEATLVTSVVFTRIDSEMGFIGGGNSSSSSGSSPFCSSSFGIDLVVSVTGDYL